MRFHQAREDGFKLEGCCSTIELHPRSQILILFLRFRYSLFTLWLLMRSYKPACEERATTSSRCDAQVSGRPAHGARRAASRPLRPTPSTETILESGRHAGGAHSANMGG